MRLGKDSYGNTLAALRPEDLNPINDRVELLLKSFTRRFQLVGVVSFAPEISNIFDYFEAELAGAGDSNIMRAWSGRGQVHIGQDGQLYVFSWLPCLTSPVEYIPTEDDDILIFDCDPSTKNLDTFKKELGSIQPILFRALRI